MRFLLGSLRILKKHSWFSVINIGGLALGLGVFMVLQLFVRQQTHYDAFWEEGESIYRIGTHWKEEGRSVNFATAPPPLAPWLDEFEEVKAITRLLNWSDFTLRPDNDSSRVFRETGVFIADGQFFRVFSGRLLAGNQDALTLPGSIVLSESALRRYFGDLPPGEAVGRTILGGKDGGTLWKITGIMKDIPATSHMEFEILVSMWDEFLESDLWTWNVMHTYARTPASREELAALCRKAVDDRAIPYLLQQDAISAAEEAAGYAFTLTPLGDVHLQAGEQDAMKPGLDPTYLHLLQLASVLVIFLACFNFTNISTALSYDRFKSVGIMRIHGASRVHLFGRFMLEYLVKVLAAALLGVGFSELLLLLVNQWFPVQLSLDALLQPGMLTLMIGVISVCVILSGAFPTWKLVHGDSTSLLSGHHPVRRSKLRSALITGQFAISLFLIACTFALTSQIDYLRTLDPGYDREQVLVIQNDREIEERREEFVSALQNLPGVTSASFTTGLPVMSRYQVRDITVLGADQKTQITWYEADENFVETFSIRLHKGHTFTPGMAGQALLNEEAVKQLGLDDPVGQTLVVNQGARDEHSVVVRGVMEDYHQGDFRRETSPLIVEYLDNYIFKDYVLVRYENLYDGKLVADIRQAWSSFEPDVPMNYFFFDSTYDALFRSEVILNQLFGVFSVLAVVIALIGLLGVVAITSRQRMREIGIRKVLGAGGTQIIGLMLRQFATLVLTACLLALPLSWYVADKWLDGFVFQTELPVTGFMGIGLAITGLAILMVALLAWRSSRLNPVEVIRTDN